MASLLDENGNLNTDDYNRKLEKQRQIFSKIDSAMAILETLPAFVDSSSIHIPFFASPLGLLFYIISILGVSEEKLRKWIVEILVYVLPVVEIGLKAELLANLRGILSCNFDPRIPLRFRKKATDSVYTNILTRYNEERGIYVYPDVIDPEGILNLSPFTQPGMMYYFGCTTDAVRSKEIQETDSDVDYNNDLQQTNVVGDANSRTAKLVRADDFNAFLWYVIHKGNKQNPMPVSIDIDLNKFIIEGEDAANSYTITSENKSLLGVLEIKPDGEDNLVAGTTFYDKKNANMLAICIKAKTDKDGEVTGYVIVPVSSDWYSCNWYVDTSDYYGENLGIKKTKPRNYEKEKAICNLRYCERYDYRGRIVPNTPNNLRFTILPKPYVLVPESYNEVIENEEEVVTHTQWRPIRLLFDADGTANQKGKFSLISETYDLQPTLKLNTVASDGSHFVYDVYGIKEGGEHRKCAELTVYTKSGKYVLEAADPMPEGFSLSSALVECYPGLTVYEFNYDYIMGMKLFDPKVVCQKIFDNAANPYYDAYFELTLNKLKDKHRYPYLAGKQRLIDIVEKIINEDDEDSEINDCFFRFSNEQYDEMLRKTEEIKYHQMPFNQGYNDGEMVDFSSVTAILNNFDEKASLEEQKYVIDRAITQACGIFAKRKNVAAKTDKSTTNVDFMTNLLEQLVKAIVDAVLSPKVLLLLMVNNALMNPEIEDYEEYDTEELMRIMRNVIKSLVREVRDLIMKKILDYISQELNQMDIQINAKVKIEQYESYMAVMRWLMSYFNKGVETVNRLDSVLSALESRFKEYGNDLDIDLPSVLDEVNYADIYPSDDKDKEPIINKC